MRIFLEIGVPKILNKILKESEIIRQKALA